MGEYKFEIYRDATNEYRWRFLAPNGNITAMASESYKNKADCEKALGSLRMEARDASLYDLSKN